MRLDLIQDLETSLSLKIPEVKCKKGNSRNFVASDINLDVMVSAQMAIVVEKELHFDVCGLEVDRIERDLRLGNDLE
jgi:hypothetical protein